MAPLPDRIEPVTIGFDGLKEFVMFNVNCIRGVKPAMIYVTFLYLAPASSDAMRTSNTKAALKKLLLEFAETV